MTSEQKHITAAAVIGAVLGLLVGAQFDRYTIIEHTYKLDRITGQSWQITGSGWVPVPERSK